MRKLEEALRNLPQPDIQVPLFKHKLRAELIQNATAPRVTKTYKWGFGILSIATSTMATLLALFILQPQYPAKINAWLNQEPSQRTPIDDHRVSSPSFAQNFPFPQTQANRDTQTIQAKLPAEESDRKFLQNWLERNYPSESIQTPTGTNPSIFTVREFQIAGGKRVLVWTKLGQGKEQKSVYQTY